MWPQLILIILIAMGLGISIKEKKDNIELIGEILARAITLSLLYWGGFFDVFFK